MKAVLSKRGWKAKLAAALAAATIAAPLGVAAIATLVPAVQAYQPPPTGGNNANTLPSSSSACNLE